LKANLNLLMLIFLLLTIDSYACAERSEFQTEQLIISQSTFSYSQEDHQKMITTLGTLKNLSNSVADDIVIEVKYFDTEKKLVDVVTQSIYGIVAPPSQEVSFRVRDAADKLKSAYVSNSVRVVSASQRIDRQTKAQPKSSAWRDILISWMPMILLIGVWAYFIKRQNKKGPAARSVELIEQQNQILARQAELLERLSNAAEKIAK
jgi:ATP-dependent Zn protease